MKNDETDAATFGLFILLIISLIGYHSAFSIRGNKVSENVTEINSTTDWEANPLGRKCKTHFVEFKGKCLETVGLNEPCEMGAQCIKGKSCDSDSCYCNSGTCNINATTSFPARQNRSVLNLSKIVLTIVGSIVFIGVVCVFTTIYRYCIYSYGNGPNPGPASRAITLSTVSQTVQNNRTTSRDAGTVTDEPPSYEEVATEPAKDLEPPSYVEYLKVHRDSEPSTRNSALSTQLTPPPYNSLSECNQCHINLAFENS